jgi:hypothetical protein
MSASWLSRTAAARATAAALAAAAAAAQQEQEQRSSSSSSSQQQRSSSQLVQQQQKQRREQQQRRQQQQQRQQQAALAHWQSRSSSSRPALTATPAPACTWRARTRSPARAGLRGRGGHELARGRAPCSWRGGRRAQKRIEAVHPGLPQSRTRKTQQRRAQTALSSSSPRSWPKLRSAT